MRDVVRLIAASPLLLPGSLLLLSGWGRRKPGRQATGTGVLLVEAADRLRARLRILAVRSSPPPRTGHSTAGRDGGRHLDRLLPRRTPPRRG